MQWGVSDEKLHSGIFLEGQRKTGKTYGVSRFLDRNVTSDPPESACCRMIAVNWVSALRLWMCLLVSKLLGLSAEKCTEGFSLLLAFPFLCCHFFPQHQFQELK